MERLNEEQQHFVEQNLRLVDFLLQNKLNVSPSNMYYLDYRQEGYIGLMLAAARFDPDRGTKFSTYASSYIIGMMQRYRREYLDRKIHTPRSITDLRSKIIELENLGHTYDEISEILDVQTKDICDALNTMYIDSFDKPLQVSDDGEEVYLKDIIGEPDKKLQEIESEKNIDEAVEKAAYKAFPRESKEHQRNRDIWRDFIWCKIFGEHITNQELADKYGLQQPSISRTLQKAKKVFKEILESDN